MAALEIVMVAAAVLLLITLFLYLWQRLGLIGTDHSHRSPPHKHLDIPPHEHDRQGLRHAVCCRPPDVERLDLRDELAVDEACARCATPLVAPASVVRQDGELYCCASCARAAGSGPGALAEGCAHCGAPIVDRTTAVTAEGRVFCCANCAVAPTEVEPPVR